MTKYRSAPRSVPNNPAPKGGVYLRLRQEQARLLNRTTYRKWMVYRCLEKGRGVSFGGLWKVLGDPTWDERETKGLSRNAIRYALDGLRREGHVVIQGDRNQALYFKA